MVTVAALVITLGLATTLLLSVNAKTLALIPGFILLLLLNPLFIVLKRLKMFVNGTPALTLTPDRLIDNIHSTTLTWTEIRNITTPTVNMKMRIRYVAISLRDATKYISSINNPYKRIIARLNENYFGGALSISTTILDCDGMALIKDLESHLASSHKNSR